MRRLAGRALAATGLAGVIGLLVAPVAWAGSDLFENVAPASPFGNAAAFARWPFFHYELDRHFTVISASITGGVDVSGLLPAIAWFFASVIWLLTAFLAKVVVELFAFAFSLDLVNGSDATGGQGALGPVSGAIHSIYANVFGAPWLVLAFSAVAIWAMWKALVQRRYSETAGALALSLIYIVFALFFVVEPAQTIGRASGWTNQMSQAFLSIPANGNPTEGEAATAGDSDQLWGLLVTEPWTVLEFGGLEHCALDGTGDEDHDPQSAPVRPLSKDAGRDNALARQLHDGTEVAAEGKTCINNEAKYASHFLRFSNSTDERDEEYEALDHGNSEELPEADKEKAGYTLGVADKPATDAMEEGGQYQRLIMAPLIAVGELGAFLLLGSLSIGVILSQVLLLLLLAFSPVALVAAAIPGRGHDFFKSWLQKLAGYLLKKAAYSLVLAVLLAVDAAIAGATSELGWLFSFGLQAAFFWAVLLQRRTLAGGIVGIVTGQKTPGNELALDAAALYAGARLGRRPLRAAGEAGRGGLRWSLGRRDGSGDGPRLGSRSATQAVDWSGGGGEDGPDTRRSAGGEEGPEGPRSGGGHDGPDRPDTGEERRRPDTGGEEVTGDRRRAPDPEEAPERPETMESPGRPGTPVAKARSVPGDEDAAPGSSPADVRPPADEASDPKAPVRGKAAEQDRQAPAPPTPEKADRDPGPARTTPAGSPAAGRSIPGAEMPAHEDAGRPRSRQAEDEGRRPGPSAEVDAVRRRREAASHGSELGEELRAERERSHRRETSRRAADPGPRAESSAPTRSDAPATEELPREPEAGRPVAATAPPRRRTLRGRIRERGDRR